MLGLGSTRLRSRIGRLTALGAAFGIGAAALPFAVFAQTAAINIDLAEFTLKASAVSAPAGTVNFSAKNGGANNHELVIVRSNAAPGSLALNAANGVDEAQIQIVKRMDRIAGGASGTLSADLTAGTYILLCNVGTHYSRGMNIAFTVTGATGSATAPPKAAAPAQAAPATGAAQAAPAAPKAGTGGYLDGGSATMQWALGGLALVAGAVALSAGLRRRRAED